uniref:Immediate early response 2b n=1 Tax=Scleropages formosus TaxID=113540 RepID=A0A8C9R0D4_SCLFO
MEQNTEAKRIMALSLGKMYSSRSQRGGLRLHRSLLLTLVMRSAQDIYHSSRVVTEIWPANGQHAQKALPAEEPMDTSGAQFQTCALTTSPEDSQLRCAKSDENKENLEPVRSNRRTRKRRGKAAGEPDFLPSKRARIRMEAAEELLSAQVTELCGTNCLSERTCSSHVL